MTDKQPVHRVLVHMDGPESVSVRIRAASMLARLTDAEILACYCVTPSAVRHSLSVGLALRGMQECEDEDQARREATYDAYLEACEDAAHVGWCSPQGDPQVCFTKQALYADYLVMQQPALDSESTGVPKEFLDYVLVNAGRPALILPRGHRGLQEAPRAVAVAWTETREAAHAVSSAMPLLRSATRIQLIAYGEDARPALVAMEKRLNVLQRQCSLRCLEDAGASLGQQLLTSTGEFGAELLVMGCYGHGPARERALGGVTRSVLDNMPCPAWMVH